MQKRASSHLIREAKPDDFAYLKYRGRFIYFGTVVDLFTGEVVGCQ